MVKKSSDSEKTEVSSLFFCFVFLNLLVLLPAFMNNGKEVKPAKAKIKLMIHIYIATQSYFQFVCVGLWQRYQI